MTDEQKFRLLEWMKAVTLVLEVYSDWVDVSTDPVKDDLEKFEQSLQLATPTQIPNQGSDHDRA